MSDRLAPRPKGQSARRRLSTITLDQAVAGGSNVLIAVFAARILDTERFGLFGLVFLGYTTVQIAYRALICDPLLIHPDEARSRTGEVLGTGFVLGLVAGVLVLAGALTAYTWDPRFAEALLVLAICMPFLAVQDLGRYLAFATQQPGKALVLDSAWLVVLLGAVGALIATDTDGLTWFIAAWAGSGAAASLLLVGLAGRERPRLGLAWLRSTWSYSWRYLLASTSVTGSTFVGSFLLGVIAGPYALGQVVGATLLVRPFMTFQIAAVAAGVGEVTRVRGDADAVLTHVRRTSALTVLAAIVNAAVMLALPDTLGQVVLGETWPGTQPLLLATAAQILLLGVVTGPRSGVLGMKAIHSAMAVDLTSAGITLAAIVLGAVLGGAEGAVWAVAIGNVPMATAWLLVLRHRLHLAQARRPGG